MNYDFAEINFGDQGRVITALPLIYLYLDDTWESGKLTQVRESTNFDGGLYDITTFSEPLLFSIYLYLGIEDSLAKSSVPHYFITPQYVVWHDSIENSYIPA